MGGCSRGKEENFCAEREKDDGEEGNFQISSIKTTFYEIFKAGGGGRR